MRKRSSKPTQSWSLGLLVMLLSVLLVTIYLLFFPKLSNDKTPIVNQGEQLQGNLKPSGTENLQWEEYFNEELGFKMSIPQFLYKSEFSDQGGYKTFIRFEQTNFSLEKGMAVGVSEKTVEEETETLKENFSGEGAVLQKEEKIEISGVEGIKLTFVPKEGQEGESRSIVIFNRNDLTYSISTTPEQIERVVKGFKFL